MKSNYKKIGDFIELVDERNKDLEISLLLGLSVTKVFIPSVANIIGTNMKNYKIIRKGQFACSVMQVRRDKKMPVALLQDFDEAIISQAYPVFQIKDETQLLPEYLMMWFTRSEFDREACFHAVGGVRGSLEWEDFLNMKLPIPSIEKQNEIVKEYNIVVNRIKLNEQLNQKLEETAQALYKHWFVDFEFPAYLSGTLSGVEGYKSSGGEMVYNEELDNEIPVGWGIKSINSLVDHNCSNYSKKDRFESIYYLDTSSITENKIEELQHLIIGKDKIPSRAKRKVENKDIVYSTVRPNLKHYGIIRNPNQNMLVSTGFMVIKPRKDIISSELIYLFLTSKEITKFLHTKAEMSVSTYPSIKPEDILEINIAFPKKDNEYIVSNIEQSLKPLYQKHWIKNDENNLLIKMKEVILSKMTKVEVKKEMVN
jgi:type I restriction enzyme S subunit